MSLLCWVACLLGGYPLPLEVCLLSLCRPGCAPSRVVSLPFWCARLGATRPALGSWLGHRTRCCRCGWLCCCISTVGPGSWDPNPPWHCPPAFPSVPVAAAWAAARGWLSRAAASRAGGRLGCIPIGWPPVASLAAVAAVAGSGLPCRSPFPTGPCLDRRLVHSSPKGLWACVPASTP